jgi:hypothetical protein
MARPGGDAGQQGDPTMHLVQLLRTNGQRAVAIVAGDELRLLDGVTTVYELAHHAIASGKGLAAAADAAAGDDAESYDEVIAERRLLAPLDHPDPAHLLVTGTGLTHLGSAATRDKMHTMKEDELTDSMKMFKLGLEGGKPAPGTVGVQPEWFYKGDGSTVISPEGDLEVPGFALDGGEEAEIAGLYLIGVDGTPWRLGFAIGNEFSDHVTERQNYLYLAHSKLRCSSFGPELWTGPLPPAVEGTSAIFRNGKRIWEKPFLSGEANMCHSFANLEHHHFKYDLFRRPGDVHVHYFGTATLSFADGIRTEPGDMFEISADVFGRPLRNRLVRHEDPGLVQVRQL